MGRRAFAHAMVARHDAPPSIAPQFRFAAWEWQGFDSRAQVRRWDALARRASEPNPFYESWYLLPSLRALDPEGRILLLCLEADGELLGLMPIAAETDYYGRALPHWRGWVHPNCFVGAPLVARGCEDAFWSALLAWTDEHAGMRLFLHLLQVPGEGALYAALVRTLAAEQRPITLVRSEARALLKSDLDPEAYLRSALPGKARSELRRKHRRLREKGELAFERGGARDDVRSWCDAFLALERRGWKGAAGSALACDPATEAIFREAIESVHARGRLERLSLTLDGRPIAMLTTFLAAPGAFGFKTAFDEAFSRFSPGVLLQRENLAMLARDGIEWTDSCADGESSTTAQLWRERRTIVRVNIGIGGALRRSLFRAVGQRETGCRTDGLA